MGREMKKWSNEELEYWSILLRRGFGGQDGVTGYWSNGSMKNGKTQAAHSARAIGKALLTLGFLLALGCVTVLHAAEMRLFDVAKKKELKLFEALQSLQGKKIILVGEQHDRKGHHAAQLEIIKALHRSGTPVAVGLEMFRTNSQDALDQWVNERISENEFQKIYYDNWGFPWALYSTIFEFARDMKLPLVALNVPRAVTQQVAREGFKSLSEEQRANLPFVECRVEPEFMDFIKRAYGAHGHGQMNFTNFCEAQLVWDKAMALHSIEYVKKNPGRTLVVLAGTGHAWKKGIPERTKERSSLTYAVLLPEIPDHLDKDTVTIEDADYLMLGISDK
jgi:uncharacterized iron-regulated protein